MSIRTRTSVRAMLALGACGAAALAALPAAAAQISQKPAAAKPAMDSPDVRADRTLAKMTREEKLALVRGWFGATLKHVPPPFNAPPPAGALGSAGYVAGAPRLGVPALEESDASLGVANGGDMRPGDRSTPLPSMLATAATWNPELAYAGGAMIGSEAHAKGFNVLLAGGGDLAREPRNGRNFEYASEDPWLSGVMVGEAIRGIQSRHVISTAKHFAVNDQETGRMVVDEVLDEKAMRESDLLAFELAIERGRPGAIMCAYNKVNGDYACENPFLLHTVLKHDWRYPGWVMSDWGGVHSTVKAALAGLDQDSAHTFDRQDFYGEALQKALASGAVPEARLDDMVHRILRSMYAVGVVDHPARPGGAIDPKADAEVAARAEEEGIVLLKNQGGLLPLAASARSIAVIGAHADAGVLSGGGSSQVLAYGGAPLEFPVTEGPAAAFAKITYHPYSPLAAIEAAAPGADVRFASGDDVAAAAAAASKAEVAIVFAQQWRTEGQDASLSLDGNGDAMIEAVAAANPHTIVVLETGGAVLMPWASKVGAIVEAWYPGAEGGRSIARALFGEINPSGKLPVTFPASVDQLPNPKLPGSDHAFTMMGRDDPPFEATNPDGSAVGYRWYEARGLKPLYPFGFGLSYTRFGYDGLQATGGRRLTVSFTVTNTGSRAGAEVAEVYARPPGAAYRRLIGFRKVMLEPGESRRVSVIADPRLLGDFDVAGRVWRVKAGDYAVSVGGSSADLPLSGEATLQAQQLRP